MVKHWSPARRKKKPSCWLWLVLVLGLALVIFFTWQNIRLYVQAIEYRERAERFDSELQALEDQYRQLEAQAIAASDDSFLERVALERLNLKRPGEEVVVFEIQSEDPDIDLSEGEFNLWDKLKATVSGWFKRQ